MRNRGPLWLRRWRYEWAMFCYMMKLHAPYGDPMLGATHEERNHNLRLMADRYWKLRPKPEEYGLPNDE
jgi:hypothetical protein